MGVLDDVLREEHERLKRIKAAMSAEMEQLPEGYISVKTIHGRQYHYLQKREGKKVTSKYIPAKAAADLSRQIERRHQLKKSLKEVEENMKKIERVVR